MSSKNSKSKLLTYILWLLGGVFGLHHFYLGRDIQGFLYWCSLGGYFGCGWISDLFHIQEYVADANEEKEYVRKLKDEVMRNKRPPFSSTRFIGMVVIAYLWSTVLSIAIPDHQVADYNLQWLRIFIPFACALGVWSVGNIGHQRGSIWWPLLTAYVSLILTYVTDESTAFTLMILISSFAFDTFAKRWKPKQKHRPSFVRRFLIIGICCLIYGSLWGSYFYFNATVTDEDGEEIPIREAIHHFLKSPWWLDVKQCLNDVWTYAQVHGIWETWKQIVELSDPRGEQHAFKVLDLSSSASQSQINSKCRTLAVKYHPDKFKSEHEKLEAHERFYEVQQACEILSSSRAKKRRRNKQYDEK